MTQSSTLTSPISVVASAFLVAFVAACSPTPVNTGIRGEKKLVASSAERQPEWAIREPASDAQFHYFRGVRSDAPSLEAGETDARQDAFRKIVEFLGLRVTVDYRRMRTEDWTRVEDAIRSVGGAEIAGTRISDLYYRQYRILDGNRVRDSYDVYVLIRFPLESVENIKRNQRDRLRDIQQLMAGPGFMAGPREVYSQITGAAQALAAVTEFKRSVLIATELEAQSENLSRQAVARLSRLVGGLRLSVGTDTSVVKAGHQERPFVISVTVATEDQGQPVPAPNIPVAISFGDSAHVQVVWTDAQGFAIWEMFDADSVIGARTISARVELPEAIRANPDIMRSVPAASAAVEIVPPTQLVKILIVVSEKIDGVRENRHFAEARLIEELTTIGFTVVAPGQLSADAATGDVWTDERAARAAAERVGATMVLRGAFEAGPAAQVQYGGQSFAMYFSTATVNLVLTNASAGNVVASITLPDDVVKDTKGAAGSARQAAENALKLTGRDQLNGYRYIAEQVRRAVNR